jgi:hypothetical protein
MRIKNVMGGKFAFKNFLIVVALDLVGIKNSLALNLLSIPPPNPFCSIFTEVKKFKGTEVLDLTEQKLQFII